VVKRAMPTLISPMRPRINFMNGVVANISTSSWRNAWSSGTARTYEWIIFQLYRRNIIRLFRDFRMF